MPELTYTHVDAFSKRSYSGNSLPVIFGCDNLDAAQMLQITQELRHFEAIFLGAPDSDKHVTARVFDLQDELPFAGHPLLGAAAVLHNWSNSTNEKLWQFNLIEKSVSVTTNRVDNGHFAVMDQGKAALFGEIDRSDQLSMAQAFGLSESELDPTLPTAVISTGLKYLILPVVSGTLSKAKIQFDLTDLLESLGAEFAVLLDDAASEIRHWNNDGIVEDVATGSAAGTIGAYLLCHKRVKSGESFVLRQGQFLKRESVMHVQPEGDLSESVSVKVGGNVTLVGRGTLEVLP